MTTPRTIPENPQPGERYAKVHIAPNGAEMWVVRLQGSHPEAYIEVGMAFTESDARLLVFGTWAVKALDFIRAHECEYYSCHACYVECRAALDLLKVST